MSNVVPSVFSSCVRAIRSTHLIQRESSQDKEFHFQNWFRARLEDTQLHFDAGARNTYPDFRMVATTDGFEVKGLAYPGREANYDCNSQVPGGQHNGRTVFYVFGRYPAKPDGDSYPVLDLVICHGDFLNADHKYVHKNRSVRGFGSYGDILIRDRKMYVAPTPFGLTSGTAHLRTLILPGHFPKPAGCQLVGELDRIETELLIVGYQFDLRHNSITPETVANPSAGTCHSFRAWRLKGDPAGQVTMRSPKEIASNVLEPEEGPDDLRE